MYPPVGVGILMIIVQMQVNAANNAAMTHFLVEFVFIFIPRFAGKDKSTIKGECASS